MAVGWNKGIKGKKSHRWKGGKNKCLDCGKLLSNRVAKKCKSCSKIGSVGAINYRGNKRYNWIEDRTKIKKQEERNNPNDKQWKYAVYKRDNFKCKMLNSDCNGKIEAHHILSWRDYPELRLNINNGITLCKFHHPRKRIKEKEMVDIFNKLISIINI